MAWWFVVVDYNHVLEDVAYSNSSSGNLKSPLRATSEMDLAINSGQLLDNGFALTEKSVMCLETQLLDFAIYRLNDIHAPKLHKVELDVIGVRALCNDNFFVVKTMCATSPGSLL